MMRELGFPVFDGDNQTYETREALTAYLPAEYKGAIRYVEVDGRTKIATMGQVSDYIPNPTFDVVAAPGAQEDFFRRGNPEGKSRRETMGKPIKAVAAFLSRPLAGADGRAGRGPGDDVPTLGQPGGGAVPRLPRRHPRHHPRPEPVDAPDVDVRLPGAHLRHPGDQPADRGARH